MSAPRKYPEGLRERAIRMAVDLRRDPATRIGALRRVGEQLGINPETLRNWVFQVEIDEGHRPGVTTVEAQRIAELERENRELRRANEILRTASAPRGGGGRADLPGLAQGRDADRPEQLLRRTDQATLGPGGGRRAAPAGAAAGARREVRRLRRPQDARRAQPSRQPDRAVHRAPVDAHRRAAWDQPALGPRPKAHEPRSLVAVPTPGPTCWIATSRRPHRTGSGSPTSPTAGPSPGGSMPRLSSTSTPGRVVGWQLSKSLRTDLALDAREMGLWTRAHAGRDTHRRHCPFGQGSTSPSLNTSTGSTTDASTARSDSSPSSSRSSTTGTTL